MKIASSTLALDASHVARREHTVSERLRVRAPTREAATESDGSRDAPATVSLSAAARELAGTPAPAAKTAVAAVTDAVEGDPRMQLLRLMIEYWTGQPVRVLSAADLGVGEASGGAGAVGAASAGAAAGAATVGFGIAYDRSETLTESEATRFSATGVVRTQDGQEIRFRVEVAMAREYREESSVSLRIGDPVQKKDPLVLNFGGNAAALESVRMDFDLDADGSPESVARLAGGSAYLVFDRNGNGRADDGSELFGPATGNGFAELAALDDDGNGWIDEGDSGWKTLGLWTPATGDTVRTLAAAGVGALATASIATPFALRGAGNAALGEVRATSVWLAEAGGAGTVQQIDLVA